MAAPRTTVWELEPHTRAKHEILRRYLQAWIPILTQGGFKNILYIDGFAGPGRYAGGEDGSPVIAVSRPSITRPASRATFSFCLLRRSEIGQTCFSSASTSWRCLPTSASR
jgi:hypothetical protein